MTRYRAEIDSLIWSHDSIEHTHYKNRHGKIYSLQPWPIDAYWRMTRHVDDASDDDTLGQFAFIDKR